MAREAMGECVWEEHNCANVPVIVFVCVCACNRAGGCLRPCALIE